MKAVRFKCLMNPPVSSQRTKVEPKGWKLMAWAKTQKSMSNVKGQETKVMSMKPD